MLNQIDIDAVSGIERTPFVDLLLDGPTLILGCVGSALEAHDRVYDGGRVFGSGGYGLTPAQFRRYAEDVRTCLAGKGVIVAYGSSFPTSAWLDKNTPETFVVWLYKLATQSAAS